VFSRSAKVRKTQRLLLDSSIAKTGSLEMNWQNGTVLTVVPVHQNAVQQWNRFKSR
jgi:hypothetical protein